MRKDKSIISNGHSIIVIDDEQGIIDVLVEILTKDGFQVKGYTSKDAALEALKSNKFDILILDYYLVDITGDKIIDIIRNTKNPNSDIYIILLTGFKDTVPPFETLRTLDIQDYSEKSANFFDIRLRVESARKSLELNKKAEGEKFCERLRFLREKSGKSQTDLGNYLGVKRTAVSNYESGYTEPDIEKLLKIADYFNISLDYLMGNKHKSL
jgi:DNA-binding response OmpR family regulator